METKYILPCPFPKGCSHYIESKTEPAAKAALTRHLQSKHQYNLCLAQYESEQQQIRMNKRKVSQVHNVTLPSVLTREAASTQPHPSTAGTSSSTATNVIPSKGELLAAYSTGLPQLSFPSELDLLKETIFKWLLNKLGLNESINPSDFDNPDLKAKAVKYIHSFVDGYKGRRIKEPFEASQGLKNDSALYYEGYLEGKQAAEKNVCRPTTLNLQLSHQHYSKHYSTVIKSIHRELLS